MLSARKRGDKVLMNESPTVFGNFLWNCHPTCMPHESALWGRAPAYLSCPGGLLGGSPLVLTNPLGDICFGLDLRVWSFAFGRWTLRVAVAPWLPYRVSLV